MKFLARMRKPLSYFKPDPMDRVVGAAKRCLNTAEGEILLKHLVNQFHLDDMVGAEKGDYITGQQDAIKYILGLTNDQ